LDFFGRKFVSLIAMTISLMHAYTSHTLSFYLLTPSWTVVEYLCGLMDQAEINIRTNDGDGGTALWVCINWRKCMHDSLVSGFLSDTVMSLSFAKHSGHCTCLTKITQLSKHCSNVVPRALRHMHLSSFTHL